MCALYCSSPFCRKAQKLQRAAILLRRGLIKRGGFLLCPADFPVTAGVEQPDGKQTCSIPLKSKHLLDKDVEEEFIEMQHDLDPVLSQGQ